MLDFDPEREPVAPRDAATVIVARDADASIEIFCVERHMRSGFMGGAVVFPGGKVDVSDKLPEWAERMTPLGERARSFAEAEADARGFAIAAMRELLEEAAMLPVVGGGLDTGDALSLRNELAERTRAGAASGSALFDLLSARNLRVDTEKLEAMSRWVTPIAETRRYDTRFYLLPAPEGQTGHHDEHETTKSFWKRPSELLALWEEGKIFLAPPTARTLDLLAAADGLDAALRIARRQSLAPTCPFFVQDQGAVVLALPGDPLYPERHSPPEDPRAPTRFVLEDGRFVPRRKA